MSRFGWGGVQPLNGLTGAPAGALWLADGHTHSLSEEQHVAEFALAFDSTSVTDAALPGPLEVSVQYYLVSSPDSLHPFQAPNRRPFLLYDAFRSATRGQPLKLYLYGYQILERFVLRNASVTQEGSDLVLSATFRRVNYVSIGLTPGNASDSLVSLGV